MYVRGYADAGPPPHFWIPEGVPSHSLFVADRCPPLFLVCPGIPPRLVEVAGYPGVAPNVPVQLPAPVPLPAEPQPGPSAAAQAPKVQWNQLFKK